MIDLSKELEEHKENIVKALKRSGTAEIHVCKDGIKVFSTKKVVIKEDK